MSRENVLFNNFTSGLLGAKMRGRVDLPVYKSGCKVLTNMVVIPQGGAVRRPGFKYIATQKTQGEIVRNVGFKFSDTISYLIEFGVSYFRFYKNGAQITSGGNPYEVTHAYTSGQLFDVVFIQAGDVMFLFHPSHHPKRLSRFGDTNWAFTDIPLEDGPYLDINTSDISIDHGDLSGVRTNFYGVAGGGNYLVVVGVPFLKAGVRQGHAQYSTDNVTWTKGTGSFGQKAFNKVRYVNSLFVAAGNAGSVMSSTGVAWTNRDVSGLSTYRIHDVVWGDSKYVFVCSSGMIRTCDSSWANEATCTLSDSATSHLYGICYNGSNLYVVVGAGAKIYTDANASGSFTVRTPPTGVTEDLFSVCYGNSVYVAVGADGVIITSSDGVTWTEQSSGVIVDLRDVTWDGERFIAVGAKGVILTSTNGTTWTVRNYYPELTLHSVAYNATTGTPDVECWVACGTNGMLAVSSDGMTWTYRALQTAVIEATGDTFDSSTDVGRHVRLSNKGIWSWGKILSVVSPTQARIEVRNKIYGQKPTSDWQLGAFYTGNYPGCGAFFNQALILGNTPDSPPSLWKSVTADFTNFAPTTLTGSLTEVIKGKGKKATTEIKAEAGVITEASAVSYVVYDTTIHNIRWILPAKYMLIGTYSGVKKGLISAFEPVVDDQSSHGVKNIAPVKVGTSVIYIQRGGKKVREIEYSQDADQLITPDLTIMCDEITESGIVDMAYQEEPYNILWMVTGAGNLIGLTFDKEHKIVGWHKHTTTGSFESVACIPGTTEDEVWVVVKRTVGGTDYRYIEQMQVFNLSSTLTNSFFVDSGKIDTTGIVAISGLAHLNGIECQILGDGLVQTNKTPSTGAITIDTAAAKVVVGIPYVSELQTMSITPPQMVGQMKRLGNTVIALYETGEGVEIGTDSTKYDEVVAGVSAGALNTVDKIMNLKGGLDRDQYVYVRQDHPLPLTVLHIATEVAHHER